MKEIFENSRFPKRFGCINIKLHAKNKEEKINCKTLIINFDSCCLSAWKDTLVLIIHLFIATLNIWEFKISQTFCMYHYQLNAKNKEGKINCKTLIANFNSCCFSAWKDTLALTIHLFIAAVNI